MMEDTLGGMEDEEEMEEAAEAEVDRILYEITAGKEPKILSSLCVLFNNKLVIIWYCI